MSIQIDNVRISHQMTIPFNHILDQGDFQFFSNLEDYSTEFIAMVNEKNSKWKKPKMYSNFWNRYAHNKNFNPAKAQPQNAIEYIIPVFIPSKHPIKKTSDSVFCRFYTHCFIYPCSLCLDLEIDLDFSDSLLEIAVMEILDTYYEQYYPVEKRQYNRSEYLEFVLKGIIEKYHIPSDLLGEHRDNHFSVSFIDGIFEEYENEIPEGGEAHIALSKLFTLKKKITPSDYIDLKKFHKKSPLGKYDYPSNLLIENYLKRILWLPSNFRDNEQDEKSKNSCFHNNLNMLTIQIKNLIPIMKLAYSEYKEKKEIKGILGYYAENACNLLYNLYIKESHTYRSNSSKILISETDYKIIVYLLKECYGKNLEE